MQSKATVGKNKSKCLVLWPYLLCGRLWVGGKKPMTAKRLWYVLTIKEAYPFIGAFYAAGSKWYYQARQRAYAIAIWRARLAAGYTATLTVELR